MGREINFQILLSKRLKFFSSAADNDSDYFIIAHYACLHYKNHGFNTVATRAEFNEQEQATDDRFL